MMKYIMVIVLLASSVVAWSVEYSLHQTSNASFKSIGALSVGTTSIGGGNVRGNVGAVTFAAIPIVNFQSTSTMPMSGSTLPNAAKKMVLVDDAQGANENSSDVVGPRKARPEDWENPYEDPLGDALLPLLLLVAGYGLFVARKRKAA